MSCDIDPICVLRVDMTGCANSFGEGACTATGADRCRRTWATCKSPCDYECETQPIYFSTCAPPPHFPFNAYPIMKEPSRAVVKPKVGKSFSSRPFITIGLSDIADNDQELNPDADSDAIVCAEDVQGSLLGRFLASYCWFEGRQATMYTGYCSDQFGSMRSEKMIVQSLEGKPHRLKGKATIKLQDPLLLTNDATCPERSDYLIATGAAGNEYYAPLRLAIELTKDDPVISVGQFILVNNLFQGDLQQDALIAQTRLACIGSEILDIEPCINEVAPAGWNFRLIGRKACGSELGDHKPGSTIFPGRSFESMHIVDIVRCLLTECTNLREAFINCCSDPDVGVIDDESFEAYRCNNPLQFGPKLRLFCKPESIKKNINELNLIFGFELYTDQECGVVKIRSCGVPEPAQITIDGCQILDIDVSYNESYQKLEVLHSPLDCAKAISEDNAGDFDIFVTDDVIRQDCDKKEAKTIKKSTVKTSWIDASNKYVLQTEGYRFTRKHRKPMRFVQIKGASSLIDGLEQNQTINIDHQCIQKPSGEHDTESVFTILSLVPKKKESIICAVEEPYSPDVIDCIDCATIGQSSTDSCVDCPELF